MSSWEKLVHEKANVLFFWVQAYKKFNKLSVVQKEESRESKSPWLNEFFNIFLDYLEIRY